MKSTTGSGKDSQVALRGTGRGDGRQDMKKNGGGGRGSQVGGRGGRGGSGGREGSGGGRGAQCQAGKEDTRGSGPGLRGRGRVSSRGGGRDNVSPATVTRSSVMEDARDIINNRKQRILSDDDREQMRILGGKCSRCWGNHDKNELVCSYPPCFMKMAHTIGACHDLMKRCRLDICKDQRGHRATCHSFMVDKDPYGYSADAVKALRETYENHRYLLTNQEKKAIDVYEEKKKLEEERKEEEEGEEERNIFAKYPKDVFENIAESDEERGGGPMRRGRGPRPSPYGRSSWIYGGFGK